jgi:farnesyl-diphosphate farnesyltransferase
VRSCFLLRFGSQLTPSSPSSYRTAIADITRLMGAGMSRYAKVHAASGGKFSVDTLASFDLYCHYVAGLVGEGLSRLFSASGKESAYLGDQLTLSNSMGLLLQKTNILRDFREDTDEGRVFWPAEIWSKYVEKPEELHQKGNEEKALWALSEMTVDALSHATDALDYLTLLSNQSVFNFCAIPQVMAIATLEVCFMNPAVMQRNVKIRKGQAVGVRYSPLSVTRVVLILSDLCSSSSPLRTLATLPTCSATVFAAFTPVHERTTPASSRSLFSLDEYVYVSSSSSRGSSLLPHPLPRTQANLPIPLL